MDIVEELKNKYRGWKRKNTALLILSILIFIIFSYSGYSRVIAKDILELGYIGSFIAGIFFVSIFTTAPAVAVFVSLAGIANPWIIALTGAIGAIIGDLIIFKILKDNVFDELSTLFNRFNLKTIKKLFSTPFFSWLVPIIGAFMIASPLPDEAGITMMGLSKIKLWQFTAVTFILNFLGILLISLASMI